MHPHLFLFFFFFNDTATTEIYTLSLHDALPILPLPPRRQPLHKRPHRAHRQAVTPLRPPPQEHARKLPKVTRSEEHTSELQSRLHLVCRLLLEKKKK